jgi:hypothetical protein
MIENGIDIDCGLVGGGFSLDKRRQRKNMEAILG